MMTENTTASVADTAPVEAMDTQAPETQEVAPQNEAPPEVYLPFKEGKEKFLVNGKEIEADWETVKRDYQLATASRQKMEEAAQIRKSAEGTLKKLLEAASKDPEGLISVLNPRYQRGTLGAAKAATEQDPALQGDPVAQRISEIEQRFNEALEERTKPLMQMFEQMQVQEEKQALTKEYEGVCQKFPVFKNKVEKEYLLNRYRSSLEQELDLSFEDVAYYTFKEIEEARAESLKPTVQKQQENMRKAPVSVRPAAAGEKKGFDSIDDVKRLIGRIT